MQKAIAFSLIGAAQVGATVTNGASWPTNFPAYNTGKDAAGYKTDTKIGGTVTADDANWLTAAFTAHSMATGIGHVFRNNFLCAQTQKIKAVSEAVTIETQTA